MSLKKYLAFFLLVVGLLGLLVSSWKHDFQAVCLSLIPLFLGMLIASLWHNNVVEEAKHKLYQDSLDVRFKIADQAAEMIATLLRVTRPHLKVVKSSWGKSEDGRYSGTAVDVTDPVEGEWWITIESDGQAKTWIGAPVGSTIKRLWKEDHNQDPAKWPEILSGLVSRKKERV